MKIDRRAEHRLRRLDTIFESLSNGLPRDTIDKQLALLEKVLGEESVVRGIEILRGLPEVVRITGANRQEDHEEGTDGWVLLSHKPDPLRINFKSSVAGVRGLKHSDTFRKMNGEIIVINSGPQVKPKQIVTHFRRETRRVLSLRRKRTVIDNQD